MELEREKLSKRPISKLEMTNSLPNIEKENLSLEKKNEKKYLRNYKHVDAFLQFQIKRI